MYTPLLGFHNLMRWIVLGVGLWAVARAYLGWARKTTWTLVDRRAGLFLTIAFDLQMLLGLLLYFLFSPITRLALTDFGAAMASGDLRFFALDHPLEMLTALILAHVGSALSRKAPDDAGRHRRAAIFYTLSLAAVLLAVPWSRPLLPGLG
jgi:hypothetical protein